MALVSAGVRSAARTLVNASALTSAAARRLGYVLFSSLCPFPASAVRRNRQERSATEQRKHTDSGWAISVLCALKLRNRGKSWQLILFDGAKGWFLLALGAKLDGKETYCESKDT